MKIGKSYCCLSGIVGGNAIRTSVERAFVVPCLSFWSLGGGSLGRIQRVVIPLQGEQGEVDHLVLGEGDWDLLSDGFQHREGFRGERDGLVAALGVGHMDTGYWRIVKIIDSVYGKLRQSDVRLK